MNGILFFLKMDDSVKSIGNKYDVFPENANYGYSVYINRGLDDSFSDIISDKNRKFMMSAIKNQISLLDDTDDDKKFLNYMLSYKNREMDLIKESKYVSFDFELEEIKNYLESNPILKDKVIVFNWNLDKDREELNRIQSVLGDYNVLFELEGNDELISLEDVKNTCNVLDDIVFKIEGLGMSPIEKIMFLYDIVRDREYVREESHESYTLSRDLSSVLLGDKIVCYGYANIFHHVLKMLGIKSLMYNIKNSYVKNTRHERVIVYVDDSKHNIKGVYYFDPTFDCKKNGNRNFLLSYRMFARTKEEMESMDHGKFQDVVLGDFGKDFVSSFVDLVKRVGIKNVSDDKIDIINTISNFVYGKKLIPRKFFIDNYSIPRSLMVSFDINEVEKKLYEFVNLFDNPICAREFFRIVFNVRKLEYYINQNDYPFGVVQFINILHNTGIELEKTDIEILFGSIFNKGMTDKDLVYKYKNYLYETGLLKDILRVEVTRKLANYLDRRKL